MKKIIALGLAAVIAAGAAATTAAPAVAAQPKVFFNFGFGPGFGPGWGPGWGPGYHPGPFYQPYYYHARPRMHRVSAHVRWCLNHYRTYNPATNLYFKKKGVPAVCHSPFRY